MLAKVLFFFANDVLTHSFLENVPLNKEHVGSCVGIPLFTDKGYDSEAPSEQPSEAGCIQTDLEYLFTSHSQKQKILRRTNNLTHKVK